MGQDKSLLDIGGHPLIAHIADQLKPAFDHLFISSNSTERFAFLNLPIIVDQQPDQGPLQGIASALEASPTDLLFVTGCDIPAMNLAFIRTLWQHTADCDCVVPMSPHPDGHVRYEPLFAFYRKNLVTDACAILKQGGRRIVELFKGHPTAHPLIPEGWYANLNTPEEYQGFIQQETRS
jgi:molybdopterin-guanine dinucleotide biosynthesis protein A